MLLLLCVVVVVGPIGHLVDILRPPPVIRSLSEVFALDGYGVCTRKWCSSRCTRGALAATVRGMVVRGLSLKIRWYQLHCRVEWLAGLLGFGVW